MGVVSRAGMSAPLVVRELGVTRYDGGAPQNSSVNGQNIGRRLVSLPAVATARLDVRFGSPTGRWVILATVLGSGMAFLDGTVVNVALPAIAKDLDAGLSGLQWTLDAYLVTLASLLLLGGSLGDQYGRKRVYLSGMAAFTGASLLCGLAPDIRFLVAARALQGVGAAMLVPGSLAILSSTFHPDDRARAIGAWSALAGATAAIGPFLGGWLVDAVSWRLIFVLNLPIAVVAGWVTVVHVPESRPEPSPAPPDVAGALTVSVGLAALAFALIEGASGFGPPEAVAAAAGAAALIAFVVVERTSRRPMLPLGIFRSRQFTGANLTTLAVYAALGGTLFLLVLELQLVLGYSALEAGASLLPVTTIMLLLSSRMGQLAQRIGPRWPMTIGPVVVAAGLVLLTRVGAGAAYATVVLPAVVVFGLGLATTVAPLTAAVLAAVDDAHMGVASGVNNAVARVAGLLAVAVLPAAVGLDIGRGPDAVSQGFHRATLVGAALSVAGGLVALATIRGGARLDPVAQAGLDQPCQDPCLVSGRRPDAA
jgi:EmrB/QacA subfamily drug resistance transporter